MLHALSTWTITLCHSPLLPAKQPEDKPDLNLQDRPKNRATIAGNVDGARVFLDGEFVCETPCTVEVPVGDSTEHEIVLRKDGYIEVMTKWRPASVTERPPQLPDLKAADFEVQLK